MNESARHLFSGVALAISGLLALGNRVCGSSSGGASPEGGASGGRETGASTAASTEASTPSGGEGGLAKLLFPEGGPPLPPGVPQIIGPYLVAGVCGAVTTDTRTVGYTLRTIDCRDPKCPEQPGWGCKPFSRLDTRDMPDAGWNEIDSGSVFKVKQFDKDPVHFKYQCLCVTTDG